MKPLLPSLLTVVTLAAGAPTLHAQVELYEYSGAAGEQLGASVAALGDVTGDGIADFAVGIPGTGTDVGRVEVRSGADGSLFSTVPGVAASDRFGYSIDALDDVDGDGRRDLVIGAPNHSGIAASAGSVHIASSVSGAVLHSSLGGPGVGFFGYSVSAVGDLDGDGLADFVAGAPTTSSSTGMVTACSGATAVTLYVKLGGTPGEQFGYDVDGVGDVDGDGRGDWVAGARYATVSTHPKAGYATLHSGLTGTLLNTVVGVIDNGELGTSVAGVGDVNGDGTPDWAVGQPGANLSGTDSGRVIVITGKGPPYSVLRVMLGQPNTRFGTAVDTVGDYDGDGTPDLIIGAPLYDKLFNLPDVGQVSIWSGATATQLFWWLGKWSPEQIGRTVGTPGDLNGDGLLEIAMGSGLSAVGGANAGVLRIFLTGASHPTVYCSAKINSAGCKPAMYSEGVASMSVGNGFRLGAIKILKGTPGMLIWSRTSASKPFGGGTLCLGGPVFRTSGQGSGGQVGDPCSGSYLFEFDGPFAASKGLAAGDTVYTQFWSRDVGFAAPNNINLTNAIEFTLAP